MKRKALVIDDDAGIQKLIRLILLTHGIESEFCSDPLMAVAMVKHNEYEFILIDYMMPGVDGIHVAKMIRKESNLAIYLITNYEITSKNQSFCNECPFIKGDCESCLDLSGIIRKTDLYEAIGEICGESRRFEMA